MTTTHKDDGCVPQVIVFPRGQLSPKDKERLTKHGIIAVEADSPRDVNMLVPQAPYVQGNDLFRCALIAMCKSTYDDSVRGEFVKQLNEVMNKAMP